MTEPVAPIDWARHYAAQREQQPEPDPQPVLKCAHCGKEIENRGDPRMDGSREARWVHVPGSYSVCFPQQSNSPRATPARHTVDTITSDAIDQLYQRVEIAEAVARDLDGASNVAVRAIQLMNEAGRGRDVAEHRAEQAEAAIERVRTFLDQDQDGLCCSRLIGQVRAALDEPKESQS